MIPAPADDPPWESSETAPVNNPVSENLPSDPLLRKYHPPCKVCEESCFKFIKKLRILRSEGSEYCEISFL